MNEDQKVEDEDEVNEEIDKIDDEKRVLLKMRLRKRWLMENWE